MAILQALFFLSSLLIHSRADCQSSSCSEGGVSVRFPFGLENQQSFMSCAHNPLFSLKCSNSSTSTQDSPVVFNLPSSGDFFVRNINYLEQEIQLYDPLNCLPRRFLKLDLSFSPFKALNYTNYTFLRCPKRVVKASYSVIHCLSNSTFSVLATSSLSVVRAMNMCETYAADLRLPVSQSSQSEDWFSSGLTRDFRLRWSAPDCRRCEAQGAICSFSPFADYTSQDIGCSFYSNPPTGNSSRKTGKRIFWIIVLCIVLPGAICVTCIGCFDYIRKQLYTRRRYYWSNSITTTRPVQNTTNVQTPRTTTSSRPEMVNTTTTTTTQTPQTTTSSRLIVSTTPHNMSSCRTNFDVRFYTLRVFEDSERLPRPGENACIICHDKYRPKDRLGLVNGCQHSFHVHCLESWLRRNRTCPLCRNSLPSLIPC